MLYMNNFEYSRMFMMINESWVWRKKDVTFLVVKNQFQLLLQSYELTNNKCHILHLLFWRMSWRIKMSKSDVKNMDDSFLSSIKLLFIITTSENGNDEIPD